MSYSPWVAGYVLVLQQFLMFAVGMHRAKKMQGMGVQNDLKLERLVRRHGNLAENAGVFIAAVVVLELITGPTTLVLGLCLVFGLARTLHAIGFSSPYGAYKLSEAKGAGSIFMASRAVGAGLSGLSGIVCGIAVLIAIST